MVQNNISKQLIEDNKRPRIIGIPILFIILTILNVFMSKFLLEQFDVLYIIIIESIIILPLSIIFLGMWISEKSSPRYISWTENKIKIINLRGKKEVISWSDIDEIEWIGEYHSSAEKYPDYLISLKGRIFPNIYVSPEIGKKLKKVFEEYKMTGKLEEIPRTEIPFYKTAKGGLLILIITFFSLFFGVILTIIYII